MRRRSKGETLVMIGALIYSVWTVADVSAGVESIAAATVSIVALWSAIGVAVWLRRPAA